MFSDIDEFYNTFFVVYEDKKTELNIDFSSENKFDADNYLIQHNFYSLNDRKFRYYRDEILGQSRYHKIMDFMLEKFNYDIDQYSKILWCEENELRDISNHGHLVGLHSHTHPTRLCEYDYNE